MKDLTTDDLAAIFAETPDTSAIDGAVRSHPEYAALRAARLRGDWWAVGEAIRPIASAIGGRWACMETLLCVNRDLWDSEREAMTALADATDGPVSSTAGFAEWESAIED
jgi:hypothetical protein